MSDQEKDDRVTLSAADAAVVDAVLDRTVPAGSESVDAARRARVEAWLKVVGSAPVPGAPANLAARTLAAVQSAPIPFSPPPEKDVPYVAASRWKRRFAEFGAMAVAAALLLIVTLQLTAQAHRARARVACANNLKALAISFNDYAQYCAGELPVLAMPASRNWMYASDRLAARNNTANLIPLVNNNFAPASAFYCPGTPMKAPPPGGALINELPPISYSYRNLYGSPQIFWDRKAETIIVTDKNPLFAEGARNTPGAEDANSPNHNGQGSYVLRADGAVTWETSPNIGPDNDNIWTVGSAKQRLLTYTGLEYPMTQADIFVAP